MIKYTAHVIIETGITNAYIEDTIDFCSSKSFFLSIRNRNAAELTCKVTAGSNSETIVVIRSYCPYSAFDNFAVSIGVNTTAIILGNKVPSDRIAVFLMRFLSLLILINYLHSTTS